MSSGVRPLSTEPAWDGGDQELLDQDAVAADQLCADRAECVAEGGHPGVPAMAPPALDFDGTKVGISIAFRMPASDHPYHGPFWQRVRYPRRDFQ